MKKFLLLVAAVVACALGMAAQQTLTIYEDATSTNDYVPIYGYYCDNYLKCEFVVPADELTAMTGKEIKKLTWYLNAAPEDGWGNANFQIFMKEVQGTILSTYTGLEDATVVYEGSINPTGLTELNIDLTTPFGYDGGNLLIGVYNTVKGSYKKTSFLGVAAEGASVQGYNGSSLESVSANQRNFIPKTTFTYGDKAPYAAVVMPTALNFGKVYPGESKVLNVKVKNNGLNAFTPAVSVDGPFSAGETSEIAAGAELEIPVTFAPTALGVYSLILTVDCGEAGSFIVDLTGVCDDKLELVVCDGSSISSYAPFYGNYYDTEDTRTQMIYPAEMLTDLVGAEIVGIKFHARYNVISFNDGALQVSVGNTESTAFVEGETGIEYPVTDLTPVASVIPATENYIWEIPFTQPYKYEGGNLAVETLVTEACSTFTNTSFYGITTDYYSTFYEYVNYSGTHTAKGWNVLPKMTIVYKKAAEEPVEPVFYVVGGFNGWSQQEGLVEIGEAGASITVEAQDLNNPNDKNQEFKIITPDVADGEDWIWLGGADDNGVGYFGITDELLGGQISLETPGANFRLPEAGTYIIKLVKDETKAHVEGIKMVVTKETVTAIESINSDVKGDNNYYNLMGQKMNGNNLPAGIYIHNGKKIIVR